MKKKDVITSAEIAALIERTETRALKEGDAELITAIIKKMVEIEGLYNEGKITSGRKLRRLIPIPRPKPSEENKPDE
jgi:hypothetical protein